MNQVINGSCNLNTLNITDADTILSKNTTSSKGYFGANCVIDADADGEFIEFEVYDLGGYPEGGNCEAGFVYYGDASLYEAVVYQGSNPVSAVYDLTNVSSGVQKIEGIYYTCGDGSTRPKLRIYSNSASAAAASFYGAQMGEAWSLGTVAQAEVVGGMTIASAGSCAWDKASNDWNDYSADADCASPVTYGDATAPGTKVPHIVFNDLPAGDYILEVQTALDGIWTSGNSRCSWRLTDDSTPSKGVGVELLSDATRNGLAGTKAKFSYSTSGDRTFKLQGNTTAGSAICRVDLAVSGLEFILTGFPSSSEQVQKIGALGQDVTTYSPGGDWSVNTTYTGRYQCEAGKLWINGRAALSGAPNSADFTFELPSGFTIDTNKITGQSLGSARILDSGTREYPGTVKYNSTTSVRVLHPESSNFGSVNATSPFTFASGDAIDIQFVVPVNECPRTPAPLLKNAVTLGGSSGKYKVEGSALLTCTASSSINENPLAMVSSLGNRSGSTCAVGLESGFFVSTPFCSLTRTDGTGDRILRYTRTSATSISISGVDETGTAADFTATLQCWGYR